MNYLKYMENFDKCTKSFTSNKVVRELLFQRVN